LKGEEGMRGVARRLFRGLAASYDRTLDYATLYQDRRWKVWASDKLRSSAGGLVLDIGCGTLLFEERSADACSRYVGVDLTEEMARLGWAKGLRNVALVVNGDAESLPFQDATFDSAISCYVPKYVSVPLLARELARVVKPGAPVVMYDFAHPRGILAPFLEVYIQAGLRLVGFVLGRGGSGAAFAFNRLPRIVNETSWDRVVVQAMESNGIETVSATPLTAGVVFAYFGRKRVRP
jgi:ubiquinone/menaquinone biosynthesis C-methylase UbiE